jgi:multiple sugar transport system permease protein
MSLKTRIDALSMPPKWVFIPTLKNYFDILSGKDFGHFFLNSIIIAGVSSTVVLVMGVPSAYTLTRMSFAGKKNIGFWILSTRMAPPVTVLIPYFIIFRRLGLLDTRLSIIIMHLSLNLPLTIWIMQGFFKDIPKELEEASFIDGCTRSRCFIQIVLPAVTGGLIASFILSFLFSWNELMYALTLGGRNAKTITASLYNFISYQEIMWGQLCASGMIILIPILVFVILVQKRLVQGITLGALK